MIGLGACAQPEPAAPPEPEPTLVPSATETRTAQLLPGSRVPATCDDIFASAAVSGGTSVTVTDPIAALAGYLACTYDGSLGGYPAFLVITISVDPPFETVNRVWGWTLEPSALEPVSECAGAFSICTDLFSSGEFAVTVDVFESAAGAEELAPSFRSFVAETTALVAS